MNFQHDHGWRIEGARDALLHRVGMFDRASALARQALPGSGEGRLAWDKPCTEDGETVVTSPRKFLAPQSDDPVLPLRRRGIGRVIIAGISASPGTESHVREFAMCVSFRNSA